MFFLTLLVVDSIGQTKLEGAFYSHDPYNWYGFQFNADNTFTHSTWACNGGGISKGTYKVDGTNLTLHYERVDTLKEYSIDNISCPPSDGNYFNKYQFSFKSGQESTYKIKKYNADEIVLKQGKYNFHFWCNKELNNVK